MLERAALGKGERREQQLKDNYLLKTGPIYQAGKSRRLPCGVNVNFFI